MHKNQDSLPDEELAKQCQVPGSRNQRAFSLLVGKYEPLVYKFCFRYLGRSELAQEATQDVFLKAYGQIAQLQEAAKFKGWVMRIAANTCSDFYRKIKKQRELQERVYTELKQSGAHISPHKPIEKLEKEEMIKAMNSLNTEDRDIIYLHYFSDFSIKEISEDQNMGESAVKMRLKRAREKLKKKLEKNVTK